ncbi:ABC transporter permease [Ktedonosporobacter rubrisoli]|uniref:ABC transporter permease n=1 Tax=Ktedonosporobacter rubrisoli TaxID=2509675 RepID=A0A4P6JX41_KTERU|nr:ABC transporter permease [Ktedonosporobacter rubrisoli]QBD80075.1 ABC transporter permease [Ktedonosporobacter rubrisoli]
MRHLLRRIGFYLVALWASITLNFLIPRLAPGDPASVLMARFQGKIQPEALHALQIEFGVTHEPLWTQYIQYLNQLIHGNLGLSITYFPQPVSAMIAQEIPWTIMLVGVSTIISFSLGTLLGMLIAWKRGSFFDTFFPPLLTFFSAIPYFWLALIALYVLGFMLNLFPVNGGYDLTVIPSWSLPFILSAIQHAILPAFTIVLSSIAGWMLGMRNMMVTTLSEDYVLLAEAKGLPTRRIMFSYAARNAILPSVTGFALSLGFVVGGALLTEIVFSYPGIGFALLQAVQNSDYALLQGIFLIIAIAVLGANFLADLLYFVLDPRVRQERN